MANNRLHLDFSLTYADERSEFLSTYLQRPEFCTKPPTEEELETMANYILWGKDRITGLNAKQDGTVELATRHGDWDTDNKCESLDALMESPTFNEASLSELSLPSVKVKREVFSRDEALAKCPSEMREAFMSLFRDIDELELKLNYYDLLHHKRTNPPREQLTRKFDDSALCKFQEAVTHWNQFQYLKRRHELIELRRQQYTLRDSYDPIMSRALPTYNSYQEPDPFIFGEDVNFAPLGLVNSSPVSAWIFQPLDKLNPKEFTEGQLREIDKIFWAKPREGYFTFDFASEDHIYQAFQIWHELLEAAEDDTDGKSGALGFVNTLKYYIDFADLSELQREILDLKLNKKKNEDIVYDINKKWNKSYTANYISTIFKQRIIPKIVEGVKYHHLIIDNLAYDEEFKQCSCCGRILLKDSINFTKKARSKDGFTSRCKKCEKATRDGKKGGNDEI